MFSKHKYTILLAITLVFQIGFAQGTGKLNPTSSSSEDYTSLTFNGVWSWFSDPRAVYYEGEFKRTYTGWIDNYGTIHIAYYDADSGKITSKVIYDNLEIDDHNNPSIVIDDKGYLTVFFNTHSKEGKPLYMVKSKFPESIQEWHPIKELYLNDSEAYPDAVRLSHTYTNPIRLAAEANTMYLFWRGINFKPTFSTSKDDGKTWSKGKLLLLPNEEEILARPYTKVFSDGKSKIHFSFTNAHPAETNTSKIFYTYYENGNFYKANGEKIKSIAELPLRASELDVVYDGKTEQANAWNWDIAQDKNGNPILVFAMFPDKENHMYCYASWVDNTWKTYKIVNAGNWFPKTLEGKQEPAPYYSGGITIDHEQPNTVYFSIKRDGVFEIEKGTTHSHGKVWEVHPITSGSKLDNVRPFAIRNAQKGNPLQVLWMQNRNYIFYSTETKSSDYTIPFEDRYHTAIKGNILEQQHQAVLQKDSVINIMRQLLDWQLVHKPRKLEQGNRAFGQFFYGMEAFYELSSEDRYINETQNIRQFKTEEEEEEEDKAIQDIFWSYTLQENRPFLERIENLDLDAIRNLDVAIVLSGLTHLSTTLPSDQIDETLVKTIFMELSEKVLKEPLRKGFWIGNLDEEMIKVERTALLVYGLAYGIEKGWISEKHKDKIVTAFHVILEKLSKKAYKNHDPSCANWNIQTTGACMLAAKTMLQLLADN